MRIHMLIEMGTYGICICVNVIVNNVNVGVNVCVYVCVYVPVSLVVKRTRLS